MATLIKLTFLILLSTLVSSCGENGILNSNSDSNAVDGATQWPQSEFPLQIKLSSDFTQAEQNGMSQVGDAWSDSHGELNFFKFSEGPKKSVTNLDQYNDNALGIYKMTTKLPDFPSQALAITQIYADRVNYSGTSSLTIHHADIIVNYADFSFSSETSFGNYDLKTVILHELGHLVGLNHFEDQVAPSIMEPSIDSFDQIHHPYPKDSELIQANYIPASSTSELRAGRSVAALSSDTKVLDGESEVEQATVVEKGIRIVHMLMPSGSCDHYEDGKKVLSHTHSVKK